MDKTYKVMSHIIYHCKSMGYAKLKKFLHKTQILL